MVSKKTSILLLVGVAILTIAIGLMLKPIPQPQTYHNFADQRSWLGVPNAWNVLSNIAFALAGFWGLYLLFSPKKVQFVDNREHWLWISFSIGLILTAVGSGYYHLMPDNSRLVWDRIPMTIVFMSLVAALISGQINIDLGLWLWPVLLATGIFSVLQWHASELRGISDLRFYVGIQEFTILVILVMLVTPSPYDRTWELAVVILFYGCARLFEMYDYQIYILTGKIISGHTLKHFAAAAAGLWLIHMIKERKINLISTGS